jgi:hypothetical protein
MTKVISKPLVIASLAAALIASVVTPSSARNRWVGPAVGFAAGAVVGSAIANSYAYYGDPYYPGAYANVYYGDPYYAQGAYAYEPYYAGPAYPAYPYYYGYGRSSPCKSDSNIGRQDQGC